MLSRDDATALVASSRLFDEHWYAALVGRRFASREAAAAAWVAAPGDDCPHPLFEPLWFFPRGAWRRHTPDPLSFYLSRTAAGGRLPGSPHPLYDADELGPLEDWLADHDPGELLLAARSRDPAAIIAVVDVPTDDVRRAVRWVRHLHRTAPDVAVAPPAAAGPTRRILAAVAVAADLPLVLLDGGPTAWDGPVVSIDPGLEPPRWSWLPPLLAALDRPGVAAAQPALLGVDSLVAAPVLVGHPVSALERLDGAPLPDRFAGVEARRPGQGERVLATGSWVVGAGPAPQGPQWAALEQRARAGVVVDGIPALRWSIDIAAGAEPIGRRWGDWHFARSLADALERLGQWVEIDHPETRARPTRSETDVVLALRGLERVRPVAGAVNLLWVISHPEDVTPAELAEHDVAFAASTTWAERHHVTPLLQCTDATRFHPGAMTGAVAGRGAGAGRGAEAARGTGAGADVLFVGNARGGMRPVVEAARAGGVDVAVFGTGWAELGVEAVADRIANVDLPASYASAGVVLNDHHADMRAEGFVSNRVFDVLAVGGRLLSDPVAGLSDLLGVELPTWETPADLARLTPAPYDAWPDAAARLALAEHVLAEHSFDARAATLLEAARARMGPHGADPDTGRPGGRNRLDSTIMTGEPAEITLDPRIPLPPYRLRMGGQHFKKDEDFVAAGVRDARVLRRRAGLGPHKRVLDWGCGAGRLAIGIKHLMGHVADYHGVDVQPRLLGWAKDNLSDEHTRFTLVDAHNARYNPSGERTFDIPADDESVDVLYAYSVFSHMLTPDLAGYGATIARILAPQGRAWMTAFVEEDVPDCVENPSDYHKLEWSGALHCVRFERRFFETTLYDAGLAVDEFVHGRETDGQSMYVLRRR